MNLENAQSRKWDINNSVGSEWDFYNGTLK